MKMDVISNTKNKDEMIDDNDNYKDSDDNDNVMDRNKTTIKHKHQEKMTNNNQIKS